MPVVGLSREDFRKLGAAAVQIAEAEGLSGHSGAIQVRLAHLNGGQS
jgi:histidinol dehydrogenase